MPKQDRYKSEALKTRRIISKGTNVGTNSRIYLYTQIANNSQYKTSIQKNYK